MVISFRSSVDEVGGSVHGTLHLLSCYLNFMLLSQWKRVYRPLYLTFHVCCHH